MNTEYEIWLLKNKERHHIVTIANSVKAAEQVIERYSPAYKNPMWGYEITEHARCQSCHRYYCYTGKVE